jgi:hypothetical protein
MTYLDRLLIRLGRNLQYRSFRSKARRLVLLVTILLLLSVALMVAAQRGRTLYELLTVTSLDLKVAGTIIVTALTVLAVTERFFRYIDSGDSSRKPAGTSLHHEELSGRDTNLSHALKAASNGTLDMSLLATQVKEFVINDATNEVLAELQILLAKSHEDKILSNALGAPQKRLEQEIAELRRRSNVNLFIGIFLGLSGLAILGWVTFQESLSAGGTTFEFVRARAPRMSLALLVEFLAYFFLRLYKASAVEVRYYHNELTNHESRIAAVELARLSGEKDSWQHLANALLETERNFVLTKEQTTAEIEGRRLEVESGAAINRALTDVVKALAQRTDYKRQAVIDE